MGNARAVWRKSMTGATGMLLGAAVLALSQAAVAADVRVGIIGLDTSHVIAFTKLLNRPDDPQHVPGARVVVAFPEGSRDIASSVTRVPEYTAQIRELGVEIVDSIDALLGRVDAVLLESNDGRVHFEQVAPVLAAGKPVFIDKPLAGSLADAVAIYALARHHGTPVFSSSSLRYGADSQAVRGGSIGAVLGCDTHSPAALEPTHPDLFWYGIHGCESLFTVMGTGCETVTRAKTDDGDFVTGVWQGGRIGTFRGLRSGPRGYGGTAFGERGLAAVGTYDGYRPLVVVIVEFFRSDIVSAGSRGILSAGSRGILSAGSRGILSAGSRGIPPVDERETLELYAFMEAADESLRRGGVPVSLPAVLAAAEIEAARRVEAWQAAAGAR